MAITTFQGVRDFINKFLTDHSIDVSSAPHMDFWNTMTYDDFVNGSVPGLLDPTGLPLDVKILVKGNAKESNLIKILQGPLTVSGQMFPQMPFGGDKMKPEEIAEIAGWIDCGCPQ
ncbi:MAG TPA: hypothetical protein VE988_00020 [Gemmataceae bacterium]|nr:hypothetical protein [Gemmataceae bacterium]